MGLGLAKVMCGLLFAVAVFAASEKSADKGPRKGEYVLVVGVPTEFQPFVADFLKKERAEFRLESRTRTFYVSSDPIPLLKKAMEIEPLGPIAKRGLWERELEKEFRKRWPDVQDPRVCLAFPDYIRGKQDDAEPAAFVLARGMSATAVAQAKELITQRVPGLPAKNIVMMGTDWRPNQGYENTGDGKTKVAMNSENRVQHEK
jgi:hypothetical protein